MLETIVTKSSFYSEKEIYTYENEVYYSIAVAAVLHWSSPSACKWRTWSHQHNSLTHTLMMIQSAQLIHLTHIRQNSHAQQVTSSSSSSQQSVKHNVHHFSIGRSNVKVITFIW